jgi:hypothetical protein
VTVTVFATVKVLDARMVEMWHRSVALGVDGTQEGLGVAAG